MRAWALVELGDSKAVDVFVKREEAFDALEDALRDEPDWAGALYVVPIELDEVRQFRPLDASLKFDWPVNHLGATCREGRGSI
jgi:hypothetical protein